MSKQKLGPCPKGGPSGRAAMEFDPDLGRLNAPPVSTLLELWSSAVAKKLGVRSELGAPPSPTLPRPLTHGDSG